MWGMSSDADVAFISDYRREREAARTAGDFDLHDRAGLPDLGALHSDFANWSQQYDSEFPPSHHLQRWDNVEGYLHDRHGMHPDVMGSDEFYTHPKTLQMAKLHTMAQLKTHADGYGDIPDDDLLHGAALGLLKVRRGQHGLSVEALLKNAFVKTARYPQEWRGDAPYGRFDNSGRARNRPPTVMHDPHDPSAGFVDPSEIQYEREGDSVSAYHPNGEHLGNYSWDEGYNGNAHIAIAQVNPLYQGQGVAGGIIDHIREHYQPDLVHSGYQGEGSLSYQGRAGALRDLGNTEEEHNDYFNTTPYNYGAMEPASFDRKFVKTDAQQRAHEELKRHFEEDQNHPNWTGRTSDSPYDPEMYDEYGDKHEYGYDSYGDYVGRDYGLKDSEGYSEEGYDNRGYDRDGRDRDGLDEEGYDDEGFSGDTGLNRGGETRHGYTPGGGQPPEGTVSMTDMGDHWAKNGLPTDDDHQEMMNDASLGVAPTMYAVREPHQRSNHTGDYHIGNGDTVYSSLDRARQMAQHPDDPSQDKDIVSTDYLDTDYLHTDATGKNPHDFHYAPPSDWDDAEDTASTPASLVHDPQRHERILGDLGHGWSQGSMPGMGIMPGGQPSLQYTNPNSGRSGQMWQQGNGQWRTEHQPEFGSGTTRGHHPDYRSAAEHVMDGTAPGPTADHHAMEVNNDYRGTGRGTVSWDPHPSGQGLTATTPHGDLHLTQSPETGYWDWHAGPHGSQPGDEGNMRNMLPSNTLNRAAEQGIQAITNRPFHGGLGEELGEGWGPHPTAPGAYSRQLPSGNHAFVSPHPDGGYTAGTQRDNGAGRPYATPLRSRHVDDIGEAHSFINAHENPTPASALGQGWHPIEMGRRSFPAYGHEGQHPSGAMANVAWGDEGGWKPSVNHKGNTYQGPAHKTPQEAAGWAHGVMNDLGNM